MSLDTDKYQQQLSEDRQRQEQSENRWLTMIDHSRQETNNTRKQFDKFKHESEQANKNLRQKLDQMQKTQLLHINQKRADMDIIAALKKDNASLADKNKKLAAICEKLQLEVSKHKVKKKTKRAV